MNPLDILLQTRKIIENPDNWCQKAICRDQFDTPFTDVVNPKVTKFCIMGALGQVCLPIEILSDPNKKWPIEGNTKIVIDILHKNTKIPLENPDKLVIFNDSHTHAEMLDLIDRSITEIQKKDLK